MRRDLDGLLEAWARWIVRGRTPSGGGLSMLAKMINTHGYFTGGSPPPDDLETRVEGAVAQLALTDPGAARILRIEYGAWWVRGITATSTQMDRAHALRVSYRTYKRKLLKARTFVAEKLGATL